VQSRQSGGYWIVHRSIGSHPVADDDNGQAEQMRFAKI
jgi:hypothetical protein